MRNNLKFILFIAIISLTTMCNTPGLDRFPLDLSNFYQLVIMSSQSSSPSIGGEVTGLEGTGLVLNLNTALNESSENEELPISQNGNFIFNKIPKEGSVYTVSVLQQPTNPNQICEVGGETGTVPRTPIRNVLIQCGESIDLPLPEFSPLPGEFADAQSVSISSPEALANIYYTLDGSNPSCNSDGSGIGIVYTTPIAIPQPSIPGIEIRAVACLDNKFSNIQTGLYRITNGVLDMVQSNPDTNPPEPPYTTTQNVSLFLPGTPPAGTTIHYTLDGSTPTCSSPDSPNPVNITESTTIRTLACSPDWTTSPVADLSFTITGTVNTPTFTLFGENFKNVQLETLSINTPGAEIRYEITTNGSDPSATCSSPIYSAPIPIERTNTKIQAIGCLADWADSTPTSIELYNLQVANPVLNPAPPLTVFANQEVSALSNTDSATFHYTTNGSDPTCASSSTPPIIPADKSLDDVEVKVRACREFFDDSGIVNGFYTKSGIVATPTFNPIPGIQSSPSNITISSSTVNAEIYFTTDGTTPTTGSSLFTTAFENTWLLAGKLIQAYAIKPGFADSSIENAVYSFLPFKTGSDICWDNDGNSEACPLAGFPDQDGELQSGTSKSYTDNSDGTISDDITGLLWQKCTKGLDANSDCTGVVPSDQENWDNAIAYCDNLTLASHTWRLPTKEELESIIDYSRNSPAINITIFPQTRQTSYWSSTTDVRNTSQAWYVGFNTGVVSEGAKSTAYYVRCVAGQTRSTNFHFQDLMDGSIKDNKTGLLWQKCTRGSNSALDCNGVVSSDQISWSNALDYCSGLTLAGRNDWRLPNINELGSIVDRTKISGALIDTTAYPQTISGIYWSSTTRANNPLEAWYVNFNSGNIVGNPKSTNSYVRCVAGP